MIPGSRKSFWGHFLVGSGSLFREFWIVLGCVWEWFGDVFGWVWDGFAKKVGRGRKMNIFKNDREYCSQVGALHNSIVSLFPDQQYIKSENQDVPYFYIKKYILLLGHLEQC